MKHLYLPFVLLVAILYTNEFSVKEKGQLALEKPKIETARAPGSKSTEPAKENFVDKWKKYFKFK